MHIRSYVCLKESSTHAKKQNATPEATSPGTHATQRQCYSSTSSQLQYLLIQARYSTITTQHHPTPLTPRR